MAAIFALSAVLVSSASAKVPTKEKYVSTGDSLAFGYSQQLFNENAKFGEPPTAFEHGFSNTYLNKHKPKETGLALVNMGCPGETTASYIGNGPIGVALKAAAEATNEAPCAYHNTDRGGGFHLPLHTEYGENGAHQPASQLEATLVQIATASGEGKPVTHLSIDIGANDELQTIGGCEVKAREQAQKEAEEEAIKEVGEGKIPPEEPFIKEAVEKKAKEKGPEDFRKCQEKEVPPLFERIIKNTGAIFFAIREGSKFGGVNYTGPIVLLGNYDPFGAVFKAHEELLPGSRSLAGLLTSKEEAILGPKFGVCTTNPLPTFNPGNIFEPARLQKYTNMANFTEFEGKKNGPDIHPTPSGYGKLGQLMFAACG
jgi:hypothetical protein